MIFLSGLSIINSNGLILLPLELQIDKKEKFYLFEIRAKRHCFV